MNVAVSPQSQVSHPQVQPTADGNVNFRWRVPQIGNPQIYKGQTVYLLGKNLPEQFNPILLKGQYY